MKATIPKKIFAFTKIEYFPFYNSIYLQITNDEKFRSMLKSICAVSEIDKLEALASCLLGSWLSSDQKDVNISAIVKTVGTMGYSYIKDNIQYSLNNKPHQILTNIPHFNFAIINGYFSWKYKNDSGISTHKIGSSEFRNIEHEIIKHCPTTFNELEPIIVF